MPFWHRDELKAIGKQQTQACYPPSSCLRAGHKFPLTKVLYISICKGVPSPVSGRPEIALKWVWRTPLSKQPLLILHFLVLFHNLLLFFFFNLHKLLAHFIDLGAKQGSIWTVKKMPPWKWYIPVLLSDVSHRIWGWKGQSLDDVA